MVFCARIRKGSWAVCETPLYLPPFLRSSYLLLSAISIPSHPLCLRTAVLHVAYCHPVPVPMKPRFARPTPATHPHPSNLRPDARSPVVPAGQVEVRAQHARRVRLLLSPPPWPPASESGRRVPARRAIGATPPAVLAANARPRTAYGSDWRAHGNVLYYTAAARAAGRACAVRARRRADACGTGRVARTWVALSRRPKRGPARRAAQTAPPPFASERVAALRPGSARPGIPQQQQ
jgi:hypothetical protein